MTVLTVKTDLQENGRCYEPEIHAGIDRGRDILMEFCLQI